VTAITRSTLSLILLIASSLLGGAGCVSDCKDDYESAVAHCKLMYDDPDDADELEQCIQSAKNDYAFCIDECKD